MVQRSPESQEIKDTWSALAFRIVTFYDEECTICNIVQKADNKSLKYHN
jgi:hypothetical protein